MSTLITIRIQDQLVHTMKRNQDHKPAGPFPFFPGPDIPAHPPFDLTLEWSMAPGVDQWRGPTPLLPVDKGIWHMVDIEKDPRCRLDHVAIKTTGAIKFMYLKLDSAYQFFFPWPQAPVKKGMWGSGDYDRLLLPGGRMNASFKWECTDVT